MRFEDQWYFLLIVVLSHMFVVLSDISCAYRSVRSKFCFLMLALLSDVSSTFRS